ncbi:MAG: hypothetical protein A2033_15235 [Bacteroidetes bacterium GWA2_31_9]|nr:MAG: hypothetical protein A2033_15235 [Bacteroidetes bacterium GWA2_31_9]
MKRIKLQPRVKTTVKITPILMYSALIGGVGLLAFIIFLAISNLGTYVAMKANTAINLTDFAWNKTIYINTGSYQQSDLYNFVFQINFSDIDFKSNANGGKLAKNDASDIVFVNSKNEKIKTKIKNYNLNTGDLSVLLLLDTLKASQNNIIEMYFGNASAPALTDTVFESDYIAYWSFDDNYDNYSIYQFNQTEINSPGYNQGINDKSVDMNGSSEYIHLNDNNNLSLADEGTLFAWIYTSDYQDYGGIIHKGDKKNFSDEEYSLQLWKNGKVLLSISDNNSNKKLFSNTKIEDKRWYYVVATWNSQGMSIFINGKLDSHTNQTLVPKNKNGGVNIGAQITQDFNSSLKKLYFDGKIDEAGIIKSSVNEDFASISNEMIINATDILSFSETKAKVITLPVELLDFQGIADNGNIILTWFTLSELNNSGFYVQNSTDGINYSEIGFVNGNGTVNDVNYYSFSYPSSTEGINYFKLMQVDIDGKLKFYGPVSVISANNSTIEIKTIYPDPFKEELKIDLTSNATTNIKIKIIDMNGREINNDLYYIHEGFNTISLKNVSNLTNGIYNLNIFDETTMIFSGKAVKK